MLSREFLAWRFSQCAQEYDVLAASERAQGRPGRAKACEVEADKARRHVRDVRADKPRPGELEIAPLEQPERWSPAVLKERGPRRRDRCCG